MKAKMLKGFFEVAKEHNPEWTYLVHVTKDLAVTEGGCKPESGVYVETCPQWAGTYGMVSSMGYIEASRLIPLRNIKANRERIQKWASAKRDGIKRSEMWYNIYKAQAA